MIAGIGVALEVCVPGREIQMTAGRNLAHTAFIPPVRCMARKLVLCTTRPMILNPDPCSARPIEDVAMKAEKVAYEA
jgi:hypothetical protein